MEDSRRSDERSGIVLKKRSSSGCLIVRKKGDGVGGAGSSGLSRALDLKKARKRPRLVMSDSGSSEDLSVPPPRRPIGAETIRVCNGLTSSRKDAAEVNRLICRDGMERGRGGRLDVFEFDEYDGIDGEIMRSTGFDDVGVESIRRRHLGSPPVVRSGSAREFESGSSRQSAIERRKNIYADEISGFSREKHGSEIRFERKRDSIRIPLPILREKYGGRPDEAIRVQGKNGVLKVLVNKKKKFGGPLRNFNQGERGERCKSTVGESRKRSLSEDVVEDDVKARPSAYVGIKNDMRNSSLKMEKSQMNVQKHVSAKINKPDDWDSEDSDVSQKPRHKNAGIGDPINRVTREKEKSPLSKKSRKKEKLLQSKISHGKEKSRQSKISLQKEKPQQSNDVARARTSEMSPTTRPKEGNIKRGSGTEKQKLRERIREMLLNAGWKIDYRPRRNRDYLDAVYINPAGTAYWSIIKAYDALQKQLDDDNDGENESGTRSAFTISDETLSQLTRKTQKKMEKEMKKQQKEGLGSANAKQAATKRNLKPKNEEGSMDSDSEEDKLSSFMKQGVKSFKKGSVHHLHKSTGEGSSDSNVRQVHGRKTKTLGRCTLLVRSSDKGMNSESDGFVPYTGKRTLLSWLIDSGVVELSQKVQYMNRRRTRALLEGWITRDGIHCGCCSKILTVSKFEIHAGSKLRQPFQNICLDSGISLLQCQVNAWNKQKESEREGFHSVDIDGDDPNDDTCGICGDGGDLICCDGCPSTFHQSCLNIQMLPPGDWQCPHCTCKYCGVAGRSTSWEDDAIASEVSTCDLCEKKYHKKCLEEDSFPLDSSGPANSFCSQKCKQLFEHLQKNLGVRHELEGGFSWSLIHRMDADSDISLRVLPQKVECNSKLAVALTIMDECFLPIIDRRSGINMIRNVLYNCGSNFNRLNYRGFYTAVLERGDEIISAASLRFHGTRLAEMPFIGTRHIYRRQGMCRRLFSAIELALCSFEVEMLIIPAISELMHTWTVTFGFKPVEESVKQEMGSLNMLVFPGLDMLQKLLLKQYAIGCSRDAGSDAKPMDIDMAEQISTPDHDDFEDNGHGVQSGYMDHKEDTRDYDLRSPNASLGDASTGNDSCRDASDDIEVQVSSDQLMHSDPDLADKSAESNVDRDCLTPSNDKSSDKSSEVEVRPVSALPFQVDSQADKEGYMDDSLEAGAAAACSESASDLGLESAAEVYKVIDETTDEPGMSQKLVDSSVADDFQDSRFLTNASEGAVDTSAENATDGVDKSRDASDVHKINENLVAVNCKELHPHPNVETENKSLLSTLSKDESLRENKRGSFRGGDQNDTADLNVGVSSVGFLPNSEEVEALDLRVKEDANDGSVPTVGSFQALDEAEEDAVKHMRVKENANDGSVSILGSFQALGEAEDISKLSNHGGENPQVGDASVSDVASMQIDSEANCLMGGEQIS